ncbi:FtsZ-binding cell division protein ZapB [Sporomusaceae bacterium BoRhaA]|uniref:hypothetical protein n=1 Tax=Pelorhabdus rhamnosifermentans TaxID=2772457 RepID=UPI001C0619F1|nr:hypothetical protein [Pelorhabdus rhamnosifermentans]MBU2702261.1 FtsZ-binding cell division protein ZapB [Pelorhabdus rhamnosifermentans]
MYTQDQIDAMTAEERKIAILELQGQATPAQEATAPITEAQETDQAAETKTPVQFDIEDMKAAIAQFEASGDQVFPDALAAMRQTLADAESKAKKAAEEVKAETQKLDVEESNWAENFRQKHGVSVPVALVVGGYIIWQIGAVVARALGVA